MADERPTDEDLRGRWKLDVYADEFNRDDPVAAQAFERAVGRKADWRDFLPDDRLPEDHRAATRAFIAEHAFSFLAPVRD